MRKHRWSEGQTIVHHFLRSDGGTDRNFPLRVISDDGHTVVGWTPVDTPILSSRLADGREISEAPLSERFRLDRQLFIATWHSGPVLRMITENQWSSIFWFFNAEGQFQDWYVNLEIPLGRTATGVSRIDGALDVVVKPNLAWSWLDEDEAEAVVEAGEITVEQMAKLRAEGERLIILAEAGKFPFDGTWTDFQPGKDWPVPQLPEHALAELQVELARER